eukprot:6203060-Pleurochrysis_carterae.AAC.2
MRRCPGWSTVARDVYGGISGTTGHAIRRVFKDEFSSGGVRCPQQVGCASHDLIRLLQLAPMMGRRVG